MRGALSQEAALRVLFEVPVKQSFVCLAVVLAASVACQKPAASQPPPASQPSAAKPGTAATAPPAATPAAKVPAAAPPPKAVPSELPPVIAKVNGDEIKRAEFETTIRSVEQRAGRSVPADQRNQVYRGVLEELIAMRLLKQEVARRHVVATDAEMDEAMKQVRKQFPTEAAFTQALAAQKMTAPQLREETRTQVLVSKMLEQEIGPQISVKPADISGFYEKNPDKFQQPEAVHASHVLIAVPQDATPAVKATARAKAADVLKQARASVDFAKLARTYSDDSSKQRGGDLGFFPKGQMLPAFEAAAFALAPNQISDVVETQFGFHIIKVLEKRPAQSVPFAEVAPRIEQFLKQQQQQEKTKVFVDQLRAKGNVEVLI
jgi:peptidyl-prolyl cis-trans isomerase C